MALPEFCPASVRADLRQVLKDTGGNPDAMEPAREVTQADLSSRHTIALGDFDSNPVVLRLYLMRMAFADSIYPGTGGHAVTTAVNPFGTARDCVVLAGSSQGSLGRSVRAFARLIKKRGPKPGFLHDVNAEVPELAVRVQADSRAYLRHLFAVLDSGDGKTASHLAVEQALLHHLTGKGRGLDIFRDYFFRYMEMGEKAGQYAGSMVYSWAWKAFIAWQLVHCDPALPAADRARLTRGFHGILDWLRRSYDGYLNQPPLEIRHNHWTYHGLSAYMGIHYFKTHYDQKDWGETERRVADLFEGQCVSYKINDDAAGYAWQVPRHTLIWALHQGRLDFFRTGHQRKLADLATMITDNTGSVASYGDSGAYNPNSPNPHRTMLALAHWFYRDPAFRWLEKWTPQQPSEDVLVAQDQGRSLEGLGWFDGRYAVSDDRVRYPDRYVGVFPLMLDRPPVDWVRRRTPGARRKPSAKAAHFDKISMRPSFEAADEYMLLEGTSTFVHGHQDGNAIIRVTWKDRVWVIDDDYLRGMPEETNGLKVVRDGASGNVPPLTVLKAASDLPGAGYTRTVSPAYNGGDWEREIVWLKRRFFLVRDSFKAKKSGEYRIERRWRVLGETSYRDGVLSSEQDGERFHVSGTGKREAHISFDRPEALGRECDWSRYPHASQTITVLTEIGEGIEPGDMVTFASLLSAGKASRINKVSFAVETFEVGGVRYLAARENNPVPLADGGFASGCQTVVTKGYMAVFGATHLKLDGVEIARCAGLDLEVSQAERRIVIAVRQGTQIVARGLPLPKEWRLSGDCWRVPAGSHSFPFDGAVAPATGRALKAFFREGAFSRAASRFDIRPPGFPPDVKPPRRVAISGRTILRGEVTAMSVSDAGAAAGFEDGRVAWIGPDLVPRWESRLSRRITAISCRGDGGGFLVAAGGETGRAAVFDRDGKRLLSLKDVSGAGEPVRSVCLASFGGVRAIVAGVRGTLRAFDMDGKLLWSGGVSHDVTPCLAAMALDGEGRGEAVVSGCTYHSPLWVFGPDGKKLASPWFRMDSTTQCMTALSFGDLDGDGRPEIVCGTLGHTILAMPPPGESPQARETYGRGRTLFEARMAAAVIGLRVIGEGAKASVIAADAAGFVARFDSRLRRAAWLHSGLNARCVGAAISARGEVCLSDEECGVATIEPGLKRVVLGRLPSPASHAAFCGGSILLGSAAGLERTDEAAGNRLRRGY